MRDANGKGLPLSVEVTVEGLIAGVYTVKVYDMERDGQTSTAAAPAHIQTLDISEPTTQTTTSDTNTIAEPESSTFAQSEAIIGGVVVAVGVSIAVAVVLAVIVSAGSGDEELKKQLHWSTNKRS